MYGKASSIDAMASRKGKAMEALGGPMDGFVFFLSSSPPD